MLIKLKNLFLALVGTSILIPSIALADGMVFPSSASTIRETDQQAVIFYEKGIETLAVTMGFEGDAKDFAWVVPVPNRPEVSQVSHKLFDSLKKMASTPNYDEIDGLPVSNYANSIKSEVTVVETKTIDYYDVVILSATDRTALSNWLRDNGYNFPEQYDYLLENYISNKWYFVAMKISQENLDNGVVDAKLKSGKATPIQMKFKTPNMVYPMRLTAMGENNQKAVSTTDVIATQDQNLRSNWNGCRGEPNAVCLDALSEFDEGKINAFFETHPSCVRNFTCDGFFGACSPECTPDEFYISSHRISTKTNTNLSTKYADGLSITLYVISDNKVELSNLKTIYANEISKKEIKKLAVDSEGNPWTEPKKILGKYFVTAMQGTVKYEDMTEDYFPQRADNNDKVGVKQTVGTFKVFEVFLLALILSIFALLFNPFIWCLICAAVIKSVVDSQSIKNLIQALQWIFFVILWGLVLIFYVYYFPTKEIIHSSFKEFWDSIFVALKYNFWSTCKAIGIILLPIVHSIAALLIMIFEKNFFKKHILGEDNKLEKK
ncbi:MAG: DUF2330 domain-containing protein [Patescibacteria group bacterium]